MTQSLKKSRPLQGLLALSTLVLLGAAGVRTVQAANTDSATATAIVLTPIAIAKNADLSFGNVVAGNGDVTLTTSGNRSASGGTGLSSGGSPAAAHFTVTGTGSNTFSIDYTGSSSVLTSGSDTMSVLWISEVAATATPTNYGTTGANPTTGTLASGTAHIYVGGKLTVGSPQPAGTYTGTVQLTVAYN
ncbi:MAG TPA: DUF4402 domain-containing protein [Roseateles sp.]